MKKKFLKFIPFISFLFLVFSFNISHAVVTDYNLSSEIGGFSGLNFNSPLMIVMNVAAAIIMIFSIINLMVGYTRWNYLASGNVDEMNTAKKTLTKAVYGFMILIIVLFIDLFIK